MSGPESSRSTKRFPQRKPSYLLVEITLRRPEFVHAASLHTSAVWLSPKGTPRRWPAFRCSEGTERSGSLCGPACRLGICAHRSQGQTNQPFLFRRSSLFLGICWAWSFQLQSAIAMVIRSILGGASRPCSSQVQWNALTTASVAFFVAEEYECGPEFEFRVVTNSPSKLTARTVQPSLPDLDAEGIWMWIEQGCE